MGTAQVYTWHQSLHIPQWMGTAQVHMWHQSLQVRAAGAKQQL